MCNVAASSLPLSFFTPHCSLGLIVSHPFLSPSCDVLSQNYYCHVNQENASTKSCLDSRGWRMRCAPQGHLRREQLNPVPAEGGSQILCSCVMSLCVHAVCDFAHSTYAYVCICTVCTCLCMLA
uniref:Uncharacterized protein n=1 Tax=Mastacembelus armatus TaxID=205130 RepID=A0A3Q3KG86_9TELE